MKGEKLYNAKYREEKENLGWWCKGKGNESWFMMGKLKMESSSGGYIIISLKT